MHSLWNANATIRKCCLVRPPHIQAALQRRLYLRLRFARCSPARRLAPLQSRSRAQTLRQAPLPRCLRAPTLYLSRAPSPRQALSPLPPAPRSRSPVWSSHHPAFRLVHSVWRTRRTHTGSILVHHCPLSSGYFQPLSSTRRERYVSTVRRRVMRNARALCRPLTGCLNRPLRCVPSYMRYHLRLSTARSNRWVRSRPVCWRMVSSAMLPTHLPRCPTPLCSHYKTLRFLAVDRYTKCAAVMARLRVPTAISVASS